MSRAKEILEKIGSILDEGTEEAKVIRAHLKKKFGLSARDASVKAQYGGTSSSVTVSLKTTKALPYMKRIEDFAKGQQRYDRDERSGSILAGGNTFIFVDIDYDFSTKIHNQTKAEIEKQITDDMYKNNDTSYFKVFGYSIQKVAGRMEFWVTDPKTKRSSGEVPIDVVANQLLKIMIRNNDTKNLKKLG